MRYQLNKNGSWNITGDFFSVEDCYPAIDGRPVRPLSVRVEESKIRYETEQGDVTVSFSYEADRIRIDCEMENAGGIHDAEPLGFGTVRTKRAGEESSLRSFIQGFGMEGPSGFFPADEHLRESNGLIAVISENRAFYMYACCHTRFINRYKIQKKTEMFGTGRTELSGGFCLEGSCSGKVTLPSIFVWEPADIPVSAALKQIAKQIASAMGARHVQPPAYHWCSWYYMYQNMSQELLEEYLKSFPAEAENFKYIQLDAGYCDSPGDWLKPGSRFPEGLGKAAEVITEAGYLPGIWIAPFIVGDHSALYREHPDWILRDVSGSPVVQIRSYCEPKVWGNPDGNYFVLDTSHPEALAYLKTVFETMRSWGFRLFKTDFMLWNMQDSSKVCRYGKGKTSVEILRDTLQVIREAIGEESYLLGCIAPFLPFIGYADGMRIAGDVGAQWNGAYSPENLLREITADNYFQQIYWQNDPDCVMLRDFDNFLTSREIRSLALLQAISGGVVTTSEPIHLLSEERRKLLAFIRPGQKRRPDIPFLGEEREDIVLTHKLENGNMLYALNPTDHPLRVYYRFADLFEEKAWYISGWEEKKCETRGGEGKTEDAVWTGGTESGKEEYYTAVLPPHGSALLMLTGEPVKTEPDNIWFLDEKIPQKF